MGIENTIAGAHQPVFRARYGWIPKQFILGGQDGGEEREEAREPHSGRARHGRLAWAILVVLAVSIPAAGGYLYSRLRVRADPVSIPATSALLAPAQAPAAMAPATGPAPAQTAAGARTDLEPLTARLAVRLERQPGDGAGWVLLARSHNELKRYPQAAAAYAKALTLVKNDPEVWSEYADVLVRVAGERWSAPARTALAAALRLDAAHPKALWLAGAEAMDRGDSRAALEHWERLATLVDTDSALGRQAAAGIAQASSQAAGAASRPRPSDPAGAAPR